MSAPVKWFFALAMLGMLIALDVSACAGYRGQHRSGPLAALDLVFAVVAGRTIGVWFGLICCRWSLVGAFVFGAAQVATAAIVGLAVADASGLSAMDRFPAALGAAGLTGLLAVLVATLLIACYATRRATPADQ